MEAAYLSPIELAIGQPTITGSLESVSTPLDFQSLNYEFSCPTVLQ